MAVWLLASRKCPPTSFAGSNELLSKKEKATSKYLTSGFLG